MGCPQIGRVLGSSHVVLDDSPGCTAGEVGDGLSQHLHARMSVWIAARAQEWLGWTLGHQTWSPEASEAESV